MKKVLLYQITLIVLVLSFAACKKESNFPSHNTATIQVIDGINQENIQVKMNGILNESGANSSNSQNNSVSFGRGTFYYAAGKSTPIEILQNITGTSFFSHTYDFKGGGIYTMLLAGISPNVEAVMIDDSNVPIINLSKIPSDADSGIYLRFINLSPDVQPLDVRIAGSSTNEVSGLPYKGSSSWKLYAAKTNNKRYQFEIVENGTVLLTRSFAVSNGNRFKNASIVILGLKNGSPSLSSSVINFYQ